MNNLSSSYSRRSNSDTERLPDWPPPISPRSFRRLLLGISSRPAVNRNADEAGGISSSSSFTLNAESLVTFNNGFETDPSSATLSSSTRARRAARLRLIACLEEAQRIMAEDVTTTTAAARD